MKRHFLFLLSLALGLGSCAGNRSVASDADSAPASVPDFVSVPPVSSDLYYGVGVAAHFVDTDLARKASLAGAETEIAEQIGRDVRGSLEQYLKENGIKDSKEARAVTDAVVQDLNLTRFRTTTVERLEEGEDGTWYSLLSLPKKQALQLALSAFKRHNTGKVFARFKAREALSRALPAPRP